MENHSDLILSCCFGGILGIAIIIGSKFTDKKIINDDVREIYKVDDNKNKELNKKNNKKEMTTSELLNGINEEKFVSKNANFLSKFNVSEDQFREAIRKTKEDANNEDNIKLNSYDLDPINWLKVFDKLIFFILFLVLLYSINLSTHGDFGRLIAGIFPREIETLGLKKYLQSIGKHSKHILDNNYENSFMEDL